ncbi:MAG: hypothetical protein H3C31_03095 [Brumimicrobium sp.]|nr:hypothetical protein [Brumimicrobium sp.]
MKSFLSHNYKMLLIALIGAVLAFFWQEINLHTLNAIQSENLQTIPTADDASYLAPPLNFLENGEWADNSEGISRYFQRPPGYGFIYLISYLTLGENAVIGLKFIQWLSYLLSIILFYKILEHFQISTKKTIVFTSIFALLPIYSGFMYYTLTEGISPFLLLVSMYAFFKKKSTLLLVCTILLLLVRPQLIIFPLLCLIFSIIQKEKRQITILLIAFLPLIFWNLRTTFIAKEWMGIHPIYSDKNISLFRPGHEALTKLFKIWEYDGERFHTIIGSTCSAQNQDEIELLNTHIPKQFQTDVFPLLLQFNQLYQREDYGKSEDFLQTEREFVQTVNHTYSKLLRKNLTTNYIVTPFLSAKYLLTKSQLNLYIFQKTFRGSWWMEILRICCVALINLGFIACLFILFQPIKIEWKLIALACLIYLFYLSFFQRMNEERYLVPLLPILLLMVSMIRVKSVRFTFIKNL